MASASPSGIQALIVIAMEILYTRSLKRSKDYTN
jgi:hypothetical protein